MICDDVGLFSFICCKTFFTFYNQFLLLLGCLHSPDCFVHACGVILPVLSISSVRLLFYMFLLFPVICEPFSSWYRFFRSSSRLSLFLFAFMSCLIFFWFSDCSCILGFSIFFAFLFLLMVFPAISMHFDVMSSHYCCAIGSSCLPVFSLYKTSIPVLKALCFAGFETFISSQFHICNK